MSSHHWLDKYGLGARKLELFDVLSSVAFHHRDGVVDFQKQPADEYQTDAVSLCYLSHLLFFHVVQRNSLCVSVFVHRGALV